MSGASEEVLGLAELEERYARELRELAESLRHPVLRAVFEGISKDSEKHAMLYRAIAALLSGTQPFISEEDLRRVASTIEKHIETETRMLERAGGLLREVEDPRVKLLAASIVDDEAEHHKLLLSIKKGIAETETFTESILWDMVWRESPWHGAPGG